MPFQNSSPRGVGLFPSHTPAARRITAIVRGCVVAPFQGCLEREIASLTFPLSGKEYWNVVVPLNRQNDKTDYLELQMQAGSVSTSCNMFQFVEFEGQKYSHIIDPLTGLGFTQQVQVTVITGDTITASAYTSALNIMQPERGIEWINELDGIDVFIEQVDSDGINSWKTSGFEKYIPPDYSKLNPG